MTVVQAITRDDLDALDRGGYRSALGRYAQQGPGGSHLERAWRAEIALYLERLEDVAAEIESLAVADNSFLARRVQIIRAEAAFCDMALDEAAALIAPMGRITWEAGDEVGYIRASLLPARIAARRGNTAEAIGLLQVPQRYAMVVDNGYYSGLAAHCRASAHFERGEFKQAGHAIAEALHLLGRSEGLRWEARCRLLNALFLANLGRYEDSILECDRGEQVAARLGIPGDVLLARTNAACTLSSLGRYEEAVARLEEAATWHQLARHHETGTIALQTLATSYCELGRFDEAVRVAREAQHVAEIGGDPAATLCGRLIRHWAGARAGAPDALERLIALVTECDRLGVELHRAEARLYVADVVAGSKPDLAAGMCREARSFAAVEESGRLRTLLNRIEQRILEGPLRIGPHGELIVDVRSGWPDFDTAVETIKRFLVLEAVRSSAGNRAEAARKLGISRSRLHDLWHQLQVRSSD